MLVQGICESRMFVLIFVTELLNPNLDQPPDLDVGLTEQWDNHVPSSTPAKQNLLSTSHCDFLLRLDHASFKAQWQPPHWKWGAPVYLEMSLILLDLCFRASILMVAIFLGQKRVVGWRCFCSHFRFLLISVPTFTFMIRMELLLMVGKYGVKNLQRKSPVLLTAFSSSSSSGRLSPES